MPILDDNESLRPTSARNSANSLSLQLVARALRKNWFLVLPVMLISTVSVAFYTLRETKIYESEATILFDPNPQSPLGRRVETVVDMGAGAYWNNQEYYKTQHYIIQSLKTCRLVVEKLQLHKNAHFLANKPESVPLKEREMSVDDASRILQGRITVRSVKESRLVKVQLQGAEPERTQLILNTLVEVYVAQNMDEAMESTTSAANWLDDQGTKLKKELESTEMSLHDYKLQKNILSVSLNDQSNMLREEIQQLNSALTTARSDYERLQSKSQELEKVTQKDPTSLPARELLESAVLQKLRGDYLDASKTQDELASQGLGAEHPRVKAAAAVREASRIALLEEIKNIKGAARREARAKRREISGLSSLAESAKKRALDLNLLEIEYNRLRRSKENTEKMYSLVLERSKESDLTRMMHFNNIRIAEHANLPKGPIAPNSPMRIGLGIVGGLLFGIGIALARELLDRTVKTPADVEESLGATFLGLMPKLLVAPAAPTASSGRARRRVAGEGVTELLVHTSPTSGAAEAARAIRTNIMFMSPDNPFQVILVTSAAPLDGKTSVASHIAIAMAQAGQRVLMVDCDLRRPRLHRVFRRDNAIGLSSLLLDRSLLDQGVGDTGVPNLSVLTSGPIPPNPAELLQSTAFKEVLAALRDRFDRIVIDSPPTIPVTDAAILSTRVDGTILVVRSLKTTHDVAAQALQSLVALGGRLIGVVLNAADLTSGAYGYRAYYYHHEGYGPDAEDPPQDAEAA